MMSETTISVSEYWELLNAKERDQIFTKHYYQKIANFETCPDNDILKSKPFLVVEQTIDEKYERKFKIYYRSTWGFLAFVVILNDQFRVVTAYPISKKNQKKIYKYRKRGY